MTLPQSKDLTRSDLVNKLQELDPVIDKLSRWLDANHFKSGSIMLSGRNYQGKDFHEILVFDGKLPVPAPRIKNFINLYAQDLVAYRFALVRELELIENPALALQNPPKTKQQQPGIPGEKCEGFCPTCVRETIHQLMQYDSVVLWICTSCSGHNDNMEID